jgi:hypothetical protein
VLLKPLHSSLMAPPSCLHVFNVSLPPVARQPSASQYRETAGDSHTRACLLPITTTYINPSHRKIRFSAPHNSWYKVRINVSSFARLPSVSTTPQSLFPIKAFHSVIQPVCPQKHKDVEMLCLPLLELVKIHSGI